MILSVTACFPPDAAGSLELLTTDGGLPVPSEGVTGLAAMVISEDAGCRTGMNVKERTRTIISANNCVFPVNAAIVKCTLIESTPLGAEDNRR